MSVDELRNATKKFSKKPIAEVEEYLFGLQDKIKKLDFNASEKRKLNLVYHRCWAFRERLIKKYYPDGEVFTTVEPHIFPEHKLSAIQDVKTLLEENHEYKNSVLIPDILVEQSKETLDFLNEKEILLTNTDHVIHFEDDGDFWYQNRDKKCYQMKTAGKRYKLLRYLVDEGKFCSTSSIKEIVGFGSEKLVSNEIKAIRSKIHSNIGFDDVIQNDRNNGYRVNPKYKIN